MKVTGGCFEVRSTRRFSDYVTKIPFGDVASSRFLSMAEADADPSVSEILDAPVLPSKI